MKIPLHDFRDDPKPYRPRHWARMNEDESVAAYALRIANDGRAITLWAILAGIIIIAGLLYSYRS